MSARFHAAVVGRAHDVAAVAAVAAGALAAARSAPRTALVVAVGEHRGEVTAPCTPAARRLRDRLRGRDLAARATGRIVWCAAGDDDPAGDAHRAAALEVPVVLAVCGPREPWVEPLLDEAAIVLVVGAGADPLTTLALAALDARGLAAAAVAPPAGLDALLGRIGLAAASARLGGVVAPRALGA